MWALLSAHPARYLGEDVLVVTLHDITQRKALEVQRDGAEKALRVSEEKFRTLTELSSDWYWEQDEQYRFKTYSAEFLDANQQPLALIGMTRGELGGDPVDQSWDAHQAMLDRRETYRHQLFRYKARDGGQRYIMSSGAPVFDDEGKFAGYQGTSVDVSERVRLQETLNERVNLFRITLDTTPVAMGLVRRRDNEVLLANQSAYALFRVENGAQWSVLGNWERYEDFRNMLRIVKRDGEARDLEIQMRIPGRENVWALMSAQPATYLGDEVLVVTVHDISDRKALERERDAAAAALRESEAKFRALTALSSDWYWEQDAGFRFTHVGSSDPRWALPMLGKTRWDLDGEPIGMTWDEHKQQLAQGKTFRNLVFRYTVQDGASMWLSVNGEALINSAGQICGYRGTATDVTRRYSLEQELKERMELFRTTLDTSPVCTALVRVRDNVVLLANQSAYQAFRVDQTTKVWNVLDHRDRPDDLREFTRRIRRDGFVRDMEVPVVVPERGHVWMSVAAQPARLQGEEVMVVTMHDISERQALQAQREKLLDDLRNANERLRLLSRQMLDAQEAERRQIAHELHDEIGQSLSALKLFAGHLRRSVPPAAHAALDEWIGIVDQSVAQVRDLSRLLRPVQLDHMGLAPALRALLDTQTRAAGWVTRFEAVGEGHRADTRAETVCYRVVQEALNNAARHADAASVSVRLEQSECEVKVRIEDDGRGFDLTAAHARVREGASMGLLGMQERVELAGGTFRIESAPTCGTRIEAVIPVLSLVAVAP
jgi:PAS domain S-box-containing protein